MLVIAGFITAVVFTEDNGLGESVVRPAVPYDTMGFVNRSRSEETQKVRGLYLLELRCRGWFLELGGAVSQLRQSMGRLMRVHVGC